MSRAGRLPWHHRIVGRSPRLCHPKRAHVTRRLEESHTNADRSNAVRSRPRARPLRGLLGQRVLRALERREIRASDRLQSGQGDRVSHRRDGLSDGA